MSTQNPSFQACLAVTSFALLMAAGALQAGTETRGAAVTDPPQDGPLGRIVGGTAANISEVPWQVALMTSNQFQFCGGSIIAPRWILTAAHCATSALSYIRAGVTDKRSSAGQDIAVARQIPHPGFDTQSYDNDVMLLELTQDLDLSGANARAIPTMTAAQVAAGLEAPGVNALISGWGATAFNGPGTNTLLKATVPIVSNADAAAVYGAGSITAAMIAAGYPGGGVDTCQGDSGGPLAVPDPASAVGYRLAGATSWGYNCAVPGYPGIYARVSAFESWIAQQIGGRLAGLNQDGQIYFSWDLASWRRIDGTLEQIVSGDFDQDGRMDLAGINATGELFYSLDQQTWKRLPGKLADLVAADLDGLGGDDLVGLDATGAIYYTTNLTTWNKIPGTLQQLIAVDLDGDGLDDLAGLNAQGEIYYSLDLSSWTRIPGQLVQLVGAPGYLAGLDQAGDIHYTSTLSTLTRIPGSLEWLVATDGLLVGLNASGAIFYTNDFSTWTRIPGQLADLVAGDLNGDGGVDLVGRNDAGALFYSTDLASWMPISGRLDQLVIMD
ncbi:MAG: serine protease [Sphingobacteriia bacterium]|nr:serine protease [Sphingobacteriia bacterium]NCC37975.1 serine protease [Gammaproteobacteria bacterium]